MSNEEKINLESLTKNLRVDDLAPFEAYLKDVWVDLYSRVTQNKNDKEKSEKKNGLSKVVFNSYYNLPGIIGDRLFKVFDTSCNNSIELIEFVKGMRTLFYEDYEKTSRFIFDFYDFDHDGKITQEDIRVVLSYITLTYSDQNSEKKIANTINISYKNRLTSQEELCDILNKCFTNKHIKSSKIDFKDFKYIIENINSDIYLMIFLFLLEKKPFSNKNIQSYEHHSSNNSRKNSPSKGKNKKLLASPTKNANFSPYRRFHRPCSSLNIDGNSSNYIRTEAGETLSPKNKNEISMSPVLCKIPRKKNTQNLRGKGIITLQPLGEDEKIFSGFKNSKKNENKENEDNIDLKRVDELTTVRKRKDNLNLHLLFQYLQHLQMMSHLMSLYRYHHPLRHRYLFFLFLHLHYL